MSSLKLFTLLSLIPLSACHDVYQSKEWNGIPYQELVTDVVISRVDSRSYLGLKLANQLEVMLVSDPKTNTAAASLDVKVGSFSDSLNLPGTAHFLEHLLFLGTEKFPDENDYRSYLSDHSGSSNAITKDEDTAHYFDVSPDALDGALDRFSQFFISPLFKRSNVESEALAVDSEYKKNFQDGSLLNQVQRNISNSNHPYSKFTIGNYETLIKIPREIGIDTREELIKFYDEFYSANIMKLVVLGKESLEDLKAMVIPKFSNIPNRNTTLPKFTASPFSKDQLGIKIKVVPKSNQNNMLVEFVLPSQYQNVEEKVEYDDLFNTYLLKPWKYISNIIDDTGKGSITSFLKESGLAYRVSSWLSESSMSFDLFRISVQLTPLGLENHDKVVESIFSYIKLIKDEGVNINIFNELRSNINREFQFKEMSNPITFAENLSGLMHYPVSMSQILGSGERISKFNETLIQETLQYMNPNTMRVTVASKSFANLPNLKKEPWYGGEFSYEAYSKEYLKSLENIPHDPKLSLPEINPIVVDDYSTIVSPLKSEVPVLLSNSSEVTLWYINGGMNIPKAIIDLKIKNNQLFTSPKLQALYAIFVSVINVHIDVLAGRAKKVGIDIIIGEINPGLSIKIIGFSDKIDHVLYSILTTIRNIDITDTEFTSIKNKVLESLKNNELNSALEFAMNFFELATSESGFLFNEKYESALNLSKSDLADFQTLFNFGNLEMFIVGNIDITKSHEIMSTAKEIMKMKPVTYDQKAFPRWVNFPSPSQWVYRAKSYNTEDVNSGIGFYLEMDDATNKRERALTYLASKIMHEPFFDQLRTKEKLGYIAGVRFQETSQHGGIWMEVQSERDPLYLESRIENFIQKFYVELRNKSETEIRNLINSHRSLIINGQDTMFSLSYLYWTQIISGRYDFNAESDLVKELGKITKEDLLFYIRDTILPTGSRRRKLSIQVVAANSQSDEVPEYKLSDCGTLITNLKDWQQQQGLMPNLPPITHDVYSSLSYPRWESNH